VAHLIGQLTRGGAESQLIQVSRALQARGWEQTVVTFCSSCAWDDRVRAAGIPLETIPRSTNKPWRVWRLWRVLRVLRPTIIHSWSDHVSGYVALLRPLIRPRPTCIMSLRNNPAFSNYHGVAAVRSGLFRALRRADGLVSNSAVSLRSARAAGVRTPGELVGNIVPARGRATPGEAVETPRILAVGALIPIKAYDRLLEALRLLAGERWTCAVAGDGPLASALQQQARHLGLSGRVEFLGSQELVADLMAAAHVLVHPSRMEGLSNTVLEAMGEGLPVVCCPVGALPEFVEDGVTGLLVEPDRPDQLAAAIRRLLVDPVLRGRLGSAGLARVRARCSEDAVVGQYEAAYGRIVAAAEFPRERAWLP
jgi:glycosyltransferase involved in cell wall biosynthesis